MGDHPKVETPELDQLVEVQRLELDGLPQAVDIEHVSEVELRIGPFLVKRRGDLEWQTV